MFSFSARKKSAAAQRYIRRLVDLTIPNRAGLGNMDRYENRHNRSIPTLLCPWEQNRPIVSKAIVAITKDFGDRGVGLVLSGAFDAKAVVVGFCHQEATGNEPWFFLGVRRTSVPIGGGFWLLGIELTEFINVNQHTELERLSPMAQKLLPSSCPRPEDALVAIESLVEQAIAFRPDVDVFDSSAATTLFETETKDRQTDITDIEGFGIPCRQSSES